MTLNDFELSKEVFGEFFAFFGCSTHFKSELRRNGWRWTKTMLEKELLTLSRVLWALLKLFVCVTKQSQNRSISIILSFLHYEWIKIKLEKDNNRNNCVV